VALAMVLLSGAGLLIRSFVNLVNVGLGYEPSNVLSFRLALPAERYPSAARLGFYEGVLQRVRLLPDVRGAAFAQALPTSPGGFSLAVRPPHAQEPVGINVVGVSRGYFDTIGVHPQGRGFGDDDNAGGARAIVLSEGTARLLSDGESPLHKTVAL